MYVDYIGKPTPPDRNLFTVYFFIKKNFVTVSSASPSVTVYFSHQNIFG